MLGFRGAVALRRSERSRDASRWSAEALKRVRDEMGLTNVEVMIPFVRTLGEGRKVIELLAEERPQARRERPARSS